MKPARPAALESRSHSVKRTQMPKRSGNSRESNRME